MIDLNQVAFFPSRETRDNTIKVLNLLYATHTSSNPILFLATDVEKAFDRLSWHFLTCILQHLYLWPQLLCWISALYSKPTPRVKIIGTLSNPFSITYGTNQGCPFSPHFFIVTLKLFLCRMRANRDIQRLTNRGLHTKVSAYVGDLLFSLTNPHISPSKPIKRIQHVQQALQPED